MKKILFLIIICFPLFYGCTSEEVETNDTTGKTGTISEIKLDYSEIEVVYDSRENGDITAKEDTVEHDDTNTGIKIDYTVYDFNGDNLLENGEEYTVEISLTNVSNKNINIENLHIFTNSLDSKNTELVSVNSDQINTDKVKYEEETSSIVYENNDDDVNYGRDMFTLEPEESLTVKYKSRESGKISLDGNENEVLDRTMFSVMFMAYPQGDFDYTFNGSYKFQCK